MANQPAEFDVIIVGAGLVGSALGCALGGTDLRVAMIESRPLDSQWPVSEDSVGGFDPRVSALTVASQQFLTAISVWPLLAGQRLAAYRSMHVWDAEGTGSIDFQASHINQPELGHIVENRLVTTALLRRLQQHANIELIAPATVQAMQPTPAGHYRLQLEGGGELQAALVVAADGANSKLRALAKMPVREWAYGHHAIVSTVATALPHQATAWQRFLPEGPLAFLPLADSAGSEQFCSIVWSAIPAYAEQLMAMEEQAFARALEQAFESRLGAVTATGPRFSFALRQRHAVDYIKPGLALVGDAAHTIHPLAGQGVNLGLMDVQVLGEELLRARQRGLEPGSRMVLERYQRRRKAANLTMMAGMEGFKRLFEQSSLPVRWARNTGMRWLNRADPLKHRLMRQAMGL